MAASKNSLDRAPGACFASSWWLFAQIMALQDIDLETFERLVLGSQPRSVNLYQLHYARRAQYLDVTMKSECFLRRWRNEPEKMAEPLVT